MIKLAAAAAVAALSVSAAVAQEYTPPVAPEVTQTAGALNSAATWTAVGVVVVGALIVDNQQSNATGTNPPDN